MTYEYRRRAARSKQYHAALLACLASVAMGCESYDADASSRARSEESFAALTLPAWDHVGAGRPRPALTFLGKRGSHGQSTKRGGTVAARGLDEGPTVGGDDFVVTTQDGSTYKVALEHEQLAEIRQYAEQMQLGRPTEGAPFERGFSIEKSLSGGIDERYRWAGTGMYPKSAIGAWMPPESSRSDCTGTLVGARVVLTAASCMFAADGEVIDLDFVADRDGSTSQPYGRVGARHVWYIDGWHSHGCYGGNDDASTYCIARDFAVVVLASAPANARGNRPGTFGYGAFSRAEFAAPAKSHAGYPWLGDYSPASCTDDWLYRDDGCAVGQVVDDDTFGEFSHGCDAGAGHGGGPVWSTNASGFVGSVMIMGMHSTGVCSGSGTACKAAAPNWGARITQPAYDLINTVKAANP